MSTIERNCAEAAYFMTLHGYYGSETKAVAALRRRKDTKAVDAEQLKAVLQRAVAILQRQIELSQEFLRGKRLSFHPQMTQEEYAEGERTIRRVLIQEHPDATEAINYFMAMNWNMPYLR